MSKAQNTDQLIKGAGYETDFGWTDSKMVWPATTAAKEFEVKSGFISPSKARILLSAQIKLNKKLTTAWSVGSVERGYFRYPLAVGDVNGELLKIYGERNPGKGIFLDEVRLKTEGIEVPGSQKTGAQGIGQIFADLLKGLRPVLVPVAIGIGALILLLAVVATRPGTTPIASVGRLGIVR